MKTLMIALLIATLSSGCASNGGSFGDNFVAASQVANAATPHSSGNFNCYTIGIQTSCQEIR